jgi:hypothetical protein
VTERSTRCPKCQQVGAAVDRITLKALLTPDGLRRGVPKQPHYCATRECAVVYFDRHENVTFAETELIVPVYAKHPDDAAMPACYCFAVSVGAMCDTAGARDLREMVAREVQAGRCACEVKNPKGACCLGDLVRIEHAQATSTTEASCCAGS